MLSRAGFLDSSLVPDGGVSIVECLFVHDAPIPGARSECRHPVVVLRQPSLHAIRLSHVVQPQTFRIQNVRCKFHRAEAARRVAGRDLPRLVARHTQPRSRSASGRRVVLGGGLEPPRLTAYAPQTYVSAIPPPERVRRGGKVGEDWAMVNGLWLGAEGSWLTV